MEGLWPGCETRKAADVHDARLLGGSLAWIGKNARPLMPMMLDRLGGLWPGSEKHTTADAHDARMLMMLDWLEGLWPRWEKQTAADAHDARLVEGYLAKMGETHGR